ncbi:MAG: tetratricopeptide repeat protein [Alphaproteobacteria bacterium]
MKKNISVKQPIVSSAKEDKIQYLFNQLSNPHLDLNFRNYYQTQLAYCYYESGNYTEAFNFFNEAAQTGSVQAQYMLGRFYLYGVACEKDVNKAREFFEKAAIQGHEKAQYELGLLLLMAQNIKAAKEWFEKSERAGNIEATYKLAELSDDYFKAANQGHKEAQYKCGQYCYRRKEYKLAKHWFTQAAGQNHAEAQYLLGTMYSTGLNLLRKNVKEASDQSFVTFDADDDYVPQDSKEAFFHYKKAADNGHKQAQLEVAKCYREGIGITQDIAQAAKYDLLAKTEILNNNAAPNRGNKQDNKNSSAEHKYADQNISFKFFDIKNKLLNYKNIFVPAVVFSEKIMTNPTIAYGYDKVIQHFKPVITKFASALDNNLSKLQITEKSGSVIKGFIRSSTPIILLAATIKASVSIYNDIRANKPKMEIAKNAIYEFGKTITQGILISSAATVGTIAAAPMASTAATLLLPIGAATLALGATSKAIEKIEPYATKFASKIATKVNLGRS